MAGQAHASAAHARIMKREWRGSSGIRLRLSHYPAGGVQERHAHDHCQVSFLLAGDMAETIGQTRHELAGGAVCVKPAGVDHGDRWGRAGVTMLSLRLDGWDETLRRSHAHERWARIDNAAVARLFATAFAARTMADIDRLADDLLALLPGTGAVHSGAPPVWLQHVREAILEGEPLDVLTAAQAAGVHRVHVSRAFAHHYGMPLSAFRRQAMTARAIQAALRSDARLAEVAAEAGFTDQSHMNRALRSALGTTPRRLRLGMTG